MKIKQSFLIFAGAALLPWVSLFAKETAGTPGAPSGKHSEKTEAAEEKNQIITGKAVRVTAAKHEMELAEVPMSVSVVDGAEVTQSSAATLADLLDDVPGVQVSSNGMPGFKQVNIRGEANSRVLILVDGQKVSEQKSMDGTPLLISTHDIDRVEVIKGPASVLYGSEAIGGVVNVITKKGSKKEGFHGSGGVRVDSATNGTDQFYSLTETLGDFSLRFSYSDEDHGNIESPKGTVKNSDYRIQNTSAFLSYDISEKATLGARFEMFRGRTNVASGIEDFEMSLPGWDRDKLGLFFEARELSETFVKFRADAYFQKTDKHFLQSILQSTTIPMGTVNVGVNADRRNKLYTYGLDVQADFSFTGTQYLIVGAQINYDDLDAVETQNTLVSATFMPGRPMSNKTKYNDYDASVLTAALYAQNEWEFAEGWDLVAGARGTVVKNRMSDAERREVNHATGAEASTRLGADDSDGNATFSLSLVNTQVEHWTFRGTIAQGYRYANINQLYIGSAMASANTEANPDLKPEQSTNYELGVRYDKERFSVETVAFYTAAEDYIGTEYLGKTGSPMSPTDSYRFVNYDKARTWGIEFNAAYDFEMSKSSAVAPYAVLTYLRRRFEDASGSTYNTGQPTLFGKFGVRGNSRDGNCNRWADFNVRANSDCEQDGEHTAGWATFNVAFGIDITPDRETPYFSKLSLVFGIDNIADTAYTLANTNFYQPGRNFWASIKYDF